jgi:hypothetical protein
MPFWGLAELVSRKFEMELFNVECWMLCVIVDETLCKEFYRWWLCLGSATSPGSPYPVAEELFDSLGLSKGKILEEIVSNNCPKSVTQEKRKQLPAYGSSDTQNHKGMR